MAKTKALISCAVTAQLICVFVFAYANCWFSHAQAQIVKKKENFQQKTFDIFLIFAQNVDCVYTLEPPRRGGSNEYQQSMFWSKNKN